MDWRKYKKTELHRHLEGSIRLETLLDAAAECGVKLPASEVETLRPHALVMQPMKNLSVVLDRFWLIQSCLGRTSVIERIAYEGCVDAYNDGIRVLELRYSPGFINLNHPNLTFDTIHAAVMKGTRRAEKEFPDMMVGFICTISRDLSMEAAEETADFAIANKKTFIGFDLAGDEVGFDSPKFAHLFKKVAKAGIGITVHSGEERREGAAKYVKESIEVLGATRIGHGVQIIHDKEVIDFVKRENVLLELCPTSNYLTRAVDSLEAHPIKQLMDLGVKACLNSDDPGLFNIDLTNEYNVLARTHGFTKKEFDTLNTNALEFTFLDKNKAKKLLG